MTRHIRLRCPLGKGQGELSPSCPRSPASLGCFMDPYYGAVQGRTVFRYVELDEQEMAARCRSLFLNCFCLTTHSESRPPLFEYAGTASKIPRLLSSAVSMISAKLAWRSVSSVLEPPSVVRIVREMNDSSLLAVDLKLFWPIVCCIIRHNSMWIPEMSKILFY